MKRTCMILEDEKPSALLLSDYISKIPQLELVACTGNAFEAKNFLQKNSIDLLFLDIQLSEFDGFSLLQMLKAPPWTIVTTAYSNYALDSFEFKVVDFLLKPFPLSRFVKSIDKYLEIVGDIAPIPSPNFILLKNNSEWIKIPLEQIDYIESYGEYVRIFGPEPTLTILMSMQKILGLLPQDQFFRIHRQHIISLNKITKITGNHVYLGKEIFKISRAQKDAFWQMIPQAK